MVGPARAKDVLYLVACAAPTAATALYFVQSAIQQGWNVRVIATPTAMRFLDARRLADLTGDRVRSDFRMPGEPDELPVADAVLVAPTTFNTLNKWAAGIADNFAVALLCELTGLGVPIIAVPQVKDALVRHSAFAQNLAVLRKMGVHVLFDPKARMPEWPRVLEELHALTGGPPRERG